MPLTTERSRSALTCDYSLLQVDHVTDAATQHVRDDEQCRTENDDEHGWEQQCAERQQQLERRFLSRLFGALPSFRTQTIGVHAHGARDRGAEAIGLNQHADQAVQIFDARTIGEIAQRFAAIAADANLEVCEFKFFTDVGVNVFQFFADFQHRRVETEARFHGDDHQVECIGKAPRDLQLAARHQAAEHEPWQDEDRKSTRLNSSHSQISYAVFCLKKKKKQTQKI